LRREQFFATILRLFKLLKEYVFAPANHNEKSKKAPLLFSRRGWGWLKR
jgi:hypothetical protein